MYKFLGLCTYIFQTLERGEKLTDLEAKASDLRNEVAR